MIRDVLSRKSRQAGWLLAILWALGGAAPAQSFELDQWIQAQASYSASAMLTNIGPSAAVPEAAAGSVVASPSYEPYYRYHWTRDAALVMDTVLNLHQRSSSDSDKARYLKLLFDYVDFSRRNQRTPNPSGDSGGTGLGEPKFNIDGSAFTGPWNRPQNDGPALRAITLIRLADHLLATGREDYVRSRLYDAKLPSDGVIKADLEFVSHHWRDSSFDVWEEVRGAHFYTRLVQRRALLEGARLADRLGDPGAARWYRSEARAMEPEILRHWDPGHGIIRATIDWVSGLSYKASGLDIAVVLGVLHSAADPSRPDSFFNVTDDRVLLTAQRIAESFRPIYGVNLRERDWSGEVMGTAIGRYPEDRYSGVSGLNEGSPWFLATNAMAELYYRCAREWESQGEIRVTNVNGSLFRGLRLFTRLNPQAGEVITSRDPRFFSIIRGLRQAGDEYLRRVRFHANPHGPLSEQFNRDSGYMQSAEELTWSHASLLTAVWSRGE